jgi:ribA/ribD-fused uncharacterized protein
MRTIQIQKISITELAADAIVNAANEGLWAGGGVCGAVFKAAGYERLQEACRKIGHCDTGSAVVTPGFDLKAGYIIHAVGPRWTDGRHGEPEQLYGAYYKSLELAAANNCRSIGFPLISAGIFGYPVRDAWRRAFEACVDFLDRHRDVSLDIVFAVLNDEIEEAGHKALQESGAARYRIAGKNDWKRLDMPRQRDSFILRRSFTARQMDVLRRGHIPQEMEDKWFRFMEGDTLFAHRSWTGTCIYRIDFRTDDHHVVTVNRDPEQYGCTSAAEDAQKLNCLLDGWTQDPQDHYNEWLEETAAALKKAEKLPDKLRIRGREADAFFFHLPEEPHGYLSNWYPSPFDLDGIRFSSVEQYIMYRKCMTFGDEASAEAVLAAEDPAAQQIIGRRAAGYIGHVWDGMRQMVAFRGLMAKFTQNEELKQKLLDTGDAYLVECAGSDKNWACGVRLNDEGRFDAENWTGGNILGFALMEVRETIGKMK